jgi:tetratricopeptide (TPR) repeat protein
VAEWSAGQVIWGLGGVLGVGAFVAWWFREFLLAYLPWLSPARAGRIAQRRDLPLPAGERFVVLIADLQGDDAARTHTRHVAAALEPYRGLEVVPIGPGPEWGVESRDAFEAKARALLQQRRGDVLISGEVATAGKGLRLRILPGDRNLRARPDAAEGRRAGEYVLTETGLPLDFDRDFNGVLVALVAASVAPATERQGHYLVDLLEPAAGRLKRLCADLPAGLDEDQRAGLWHALALAASVLGDQKGESAWLQDAVAAYRAALEVWTRERIPLQWAMAQNNLGNALGTLGARENGTERLLQAVDAFHAALEVRTRERVPLDWAMTQNNLGNALRTLGAREDGTERLLQAVDAFHAALEVWTRERVPLQWATTQNNLGNALGTLGEREDGTERLLQAIGAFRAALEVRTRERVPLDWAMTQNNLGAALGTLGAREDGTERLLQAVDACRAALEVWTRERVPLDWAWTQDNLGNALRTLGEREDGTARLEQAGLAYRAALEVLRPAGATHYVGIAERNLARVEALLAERRGDSAAE